MARRIIWSADARKHKKEILKYWTDHNKSKTYSRKLDHLFRESLDRLLLYPHSGRQTTKDNISVLVVSNFLIFYTILSSSDILIVGIRDGRREPLFYPPFFSAILYASRHLFRANSCSTIGLGNSGVPYSGTHLRRYLSSGSNFLS